MIKYNNLQANKEFEIILCRQKNERNRFHSSIFLKNGNPAVSRRCCPNKRIAISTQLFYSQYALFLQQKHLVANGKK